MRTESLIDHLVKSRLAGSVETSVANTKTKIRRLLADDPNCTFGLSDCSTATEESIAQALTLTAGAELDVDDETFGYIDPQATIRGIRRYAAVLAPFLTRGGRNILLATGHPTGLLEHYMVLARELENRGNLLLRVHDDGPDITPATLRLPARTMRFVGSVGCVFQGPGNGLSLVHSHLSAYMEAMLDELAAAGQKVDLVIGDHGMAGAAIERGIPTLAIADVNDVALSLAYANKRIDGLFVIDDNLPPHLFRPVTNCILGIARSHC